MSVTTILQQQQIVLPRPRPRRPRRPLLHHRRRPPRRHRLPHNNPKSVRKAKHLHLMRTKQANA